MPFETENDLLPLLANKGIAHTFTNPAAIPTGAPVDHAVVVAIQRKHDTFPPER